MIARAPRRNSAPPERRETITAEVARRFPQEIAKHVATVRLNDGVFRHIECREPGTWNRHFQVTTWPGHLAITGDMGAFVFSRLPDMFEFFRLDRGRINASYWAEKTVATDRSGVRQYDPDRFRAAIVRRYREWLKSCSDELTGDERRELRHRVRDEVLSRADDGEHFALQAAYEFTHDADPVFPDFWETGLKEWTYHYLWCCHAIVWAIAQWDALVAAPPAQVEVPA